MEFKGLFLFAAKLGHYFRIVIILRDLPHSVNSDIRMKSR